MFIVNTLGLNKMHLYKDNILQLSRVYNYKFGDREIYKFDGL